MLSTTHSIHPSKIFLRCHSLLPIPTSMMISATPEVRDEFWIGNGTGNPGVFQGNPYLYLYLYTWVRVGYVNQYIILLLLNYLFNIRLIGIKDLFTLGQCEAPTPFPWTCEFSLDFSTLWEALSMNLRILTWLLHSVELVCFCLLCRS